jgi:hypothetical protein
MVNLNNKINDIKVKNSMLDRLKDEIIKKYESISQKESMKNGDSFVQTEANTIGIRNKQKSAITQLKLLHNHLEHNYVLLLKNLSKKLIKPKDIFKRPDPSLLVKKFK